MIYLDDYPEDFYGYSDPEGCPACGIIWAILITVSVVCVAIGYFHS